MLYYRIPETELLLNPDTDVAHYRQHVNALIQPGSRFLIEEWHMGGVTALFYSLYLATRIARTDLAVESQIAEISLTALISLEQMALTDKLSYAPLPVYKLAAKLFHNERLDAKLRFMAADYLGQHMAAAQVALTAALDLAYVEDDQQPYTSETLVESMFGSFAVVRMHLYMAGLLLHMADKALARIDWPAYTALIGVFNRGVTFFIEACEMPDLEPLPPHLATEGLLLANEGYSVCMLHRSRHLSAVNRQGIERLTRRLAEELLDFVTNPRFAVLVEGQNADTYHYYSQFSDFSFWDHYIPGLTAEVQRIHRSWTAYLARPTSGLST